ncbi:MAG: hypothetical protein KIT22_11825 [Verrucomicrobiae bacterium]|nr:hypothetical protein [Verrucomicrobiae bacterium]
MPRELDRIVRLYASRNRLSVEKSLGAGIHGQVFFVRGNSIAGGTAIKVFYAEEPFRRELRVYERLRDANVRKIRGFAVPQLIQADSALLVLEMTVVERPYVLDFAGAYLDEDAPQFPEEVWETWEADKREKFGEHWREVKAMLAALEEYDIHMLDVNPGNVAFEN